MSAVAEAEHWVKESDPHTTAIETMAMSEKQWTKEKEEHVLQAGEKTTHAASEATSKVDVARAASHNWAAIPQKCDMYEDEGEKCVLQKTRQSSGLANEESGGEKETCRALKVDKAIDRRRSQMNGAIRVLENTEREPAVANFLQQQGISGVKSLKRGVMSTNWPLHQAAELDDERVVELLLLEGDLSQEKQATGKTALQVAQKMDKAGSHAAVSALLGSESAASQSFFGGA